MYSPNMQQKTSGSLQYRLRLLVPLIMKHLILTEILLQVFLQMIEAQSVAKSFSLLSLYLKSRNVKASGSNSG